MAVNTDADAREVDPRALTCTNRGVALLDAHNPALPAVGTAPALAKGTSSIEPASGAEKAAAAQLEALGPTATGHIHEAPSPGGERIRKPEAPLQEGERTGKSEAPTPGASAWANQRRCH